MEERLKKALAEASPVQTKLETIPQHAYLLGNGDLVCLVMGNENEFVLNLTKNDVWDKRLITEDDADIITNKEIIQKAMAVPYGKKTLEVNLDSNDPINGKSSSYRRPYPCPVLCAQLKIPADMEHASHRLELASATVQSTLRTGNLRFYISYHRNVLCIEGLTEKMTSTWIPIDHADMDPATVTIRNGYSVLLQHMPADPDVKEYWYAVVSKRIGVDRLAVTIEADTDAARAIDSALAALDGFCEEKNGYETHVKHWEAYWNRSYMEMDDKILQNVWYRNTYGLGCIARSGCVSPGLFAGLSSDTPAWHGDYHTNYNYQAIFWGAYITNHCDLADVYDDIILSYRKRAQWLAKRVWDIDGAYYPHVLFYGEPEDPALCKSKNGRQYFHHVWGRTLGVSAMTVQNLVMHMYYDPSKALTEKLYPVLCDCADFYIRLGDLNEAFTVSPEHWGITPQTYLNHVCTFDITLIKYLLKGCIKAAEILGIDEEKRMIWQEYLDHLPPYPTTDDYEAAMATDRGFFDAHIPKDFGYTSNITYPVRMITDIKNAPPIMYNIPASILPIFPGCDIDLASSKAEQKLAADSMKNIRTNGNNDFVMSAVSRIRMCMDDRYDFLHRRVAVQEMANGFLAMCEDPQHVFNTFGIYTEMFGITLAISELMLQSNKGYIRLFPAMPKGQNACFRHMLAEGGVLVSAQWNHGTVENLCLQPKYDGQICLCVPEGKTPVVICDGQPVECETFRNDGGEEVVRFFGVAGKCYTV